MSISTHYLLHHLAVELWDFYPQKLLHRTSVYTRTHLVNKFHNIFSLSLEELEVADHGEEELRVFLLGTGFELVGFAKVELVTHVGGVFEGVIGGVFERRV